MDDMCVVRKPPRRSKAATLAALKNDPGKERIGHNDHATLIEYGRKRAKKGAGPVTPGIDTDMINTHTGRRPRARHFFRTGRPRPHCLEAAGSDWQSTERHRRPTRDELNRLFRCFNNNERLTLSMTRIGHFAVATAMRLDEICRVKWRHLDVERRMFLTRDRKDPRNKTRNDQRSPLFDATGFDAWTQIMAQANISGSLRAR